MIHKIKNFSLFPPSFLALVSSLDSFWWQLCHFISLSAFGFLALKFTKTRTSPSSSPQNLDLFFTSVSSATVSSMSVVEMEVFSNAQLIIITILMFLGGEIFVSMVEFKLSHMLKFPSVMQNLELETGRDHQNDLKSRSLKLLGHVILCYLVAANFLGFSFVALYMATIPHAKHVLEKKGLNLLTFSLFSTVSSLTNCGFIPTNENMIVFKKDSGLLLLLTAQILVGGCLYSPCLRFVIWVMEKVTRKEEFGFILKKFWEMGYSHLLSGDRSCFQAVTAVGFIVMQMILFCSLEWRSEGLWEEMNPYRKMIASLFQVTNSRHAGESVVDISVISPAILVVFVIMMYLPPHTTFLPRGSEEKEKGLKPKGERKRQSIVELMSLSQLSYLAIFIILICITEAQHLKDDPLNFTVLNITLEVISAYGNVGFSTGYSCKRQLKPDSSCKDAWYGFAGRWTKKGKLILILVMFFGRLKHFNGGKAWKLS